MNASTTFNEYEKSKKGAKTKARRGPIQSMTIRKADNGFITEAEHADANPDQPLNWEERRRQKVHKTAEEVAGHVSKMFGGKEMVPVGEEAEEESEAAGSGDPNESKENE